MSIFTTIWNLKVYAFLVLLWIITFGFGIANFRNPDTTKIHPTQFRKTLQEWYMVTIECIVFMFGIRNYEPLMSILQSMKLWLTGMQVLFAIALLFYTIKRWQKVTVLEMNETALILWFMAGCLSTAVALDISEHMFGWLGDMLMVMIFGYSIISYMWAPAYKKIFLAKRGNPPPVTT